VSAAYVLLILITALLLAGALFTDRLTRLVQALRAKTPGSRRRFSPIRISINVEPGEQEKAFPAPRPKGLPTRRTARGKGVP
jgi:hypothetical protein